METRSRRLAAFAGAALLTSGAVVGVLQLSRSESRPVEVQVGPLRCANPEIVLNGELWQTVDVLPDVFERGERFAATLHVSGSSATLEGAGFELRYERNDSNFAGSRCALVG